MSVTALTVYIPLGWEYFTNINMPANIGLLTLQRASQVSAYWQTTSRLSTKYGWPKATTCHLHYTNGSSTCLHDPDEMMITMGWYRTYPLSHMLQTNVTVIMVLV